MQNGVESVVVQTAPLPGIVPTSQPSCNTSEGVLSVAVTAEEVKERCPPKAMVKPQVLTHVIEDFVIQESSEPFPVHRSSLGDLKPTQSSNEKDSEEPPREYFFNAIFILVLIFKWGPYLYFIFLSIWIFSVFQFKRHPSHVFFSFT